MIQLRPNQGDLERLKEPFGKLILGDPPKTMPELNSIISRLHPRKVVAVGDVVSRETYAAGIRVDLRIIDHISMRKPTATFNLKPKTTYHVKNPPGVMNHESREAIKRAMKADDAVIVGDGEDDLLGRRCLLHSPA